MVLNIEGVRLLALDTSVRLGKLLASRDSEVSVSSRGIVGIVCVSSEGKVNSACDWDAKLEAYLSVKGSIGGGSLRHATRQTKPCSLSSRSLNRWRLRMSNITRTETIMSDKAPIVAPIIIATFLFGGFEFPNAVVEEGDDL
jgi:hypothetical protein